MLSLSLIGCPPGVYSARIQHAREEVSKANNPMLVVELALIEPSKTVITTYLAWIGTRSVAIGRFMKSLQLPLVEGSVAKVERPAELIGKTCRVEVQLEQGTDGPRLYIADWLPPLTDEHVAITIADESSV